MAEGRHFENGFIAISQPRIIRFQWHLVCLHKLCFQEQSLTKNQNFTNSKWRTAAILKIVLSYTSTIYCSINAKLDRRSKIMLRHRSGDQNYKFQKIQDGGRPPFWKWFYRYISVGYHPILMKFGVQMHNLFPRAVTVKQSKFYQFKMADGCHIENCFGAKYQRFIVQLTRYLVRRSTITLRHRSYDQPCVQ